MRRCRLPAYGGAGEPWAWVIGLVSMLLFWGGLIALAVWGIRALTRRQPAGLSAMEILRRRLAAGDITAEQDEQTRKALEG